MATVRHGLSVGVERIGDEVFIGLKVTGTLTHEDYQIFTPVLEAALKAVEQPQVKMLVDLSEFHGWEIRAAWDDLKVGLKHGSEFRKIALYGGKPWHEAAAKVGGWFSGGKIKSFETGIEAMEWLDLND